MDIDEDLRRIALQEERLRFDTFTPDTAWRLGSLLRETAVARQAGVAIDVTLFAQPMFYTALPGATADNADWIRRKRNVVFRFLRSSYAVGRELAQKQSSLQAIQALDERDYATHGGSFPIMLGATGCIGAATVSGLPQRHDHNLVVETIAQLLGIDIGDIALSQE